MKFLLTWGTKVHRQVLPSYSAKHIKCGLVQILNLLPSEAPILLADKGKKQSSQAVPGVFNKHVTCQHSILMLFLLLRRYFGVSNPTQAQNDNPGLTCKT